MTLKVDGTNGVLQAYDYQVLTTGFSYTFASGTQTLVINPAGTLATGTVTMPASPVDGMTITVVSTQQVTAVTIAGNTGQTLVGGAAQLIPNQPLSFVYRLANTTWYPFAGGAGRASSLVIGTSVASTSGTSIDFTGIPFWVKRITVLYNQVSSNGSAVPMVQLGTSGGVVTSGYASWTGYVSASANTTRGASYTNGFGMAWSGSAADSTTGNLVITLISGTTWVATGIGNFGSGNVNYYSGSLAVGGTLDRVRFTMNNGTDVFDAGTVNILYE